MRGARHRVYILLIPFVEALFAGGGAPSAGEGAIQRLLDATVYRWVDPRRRPTRRDQPRDRLGGRGSRPQEPLPVRSWLPGRPGGAAREPRPARFGVRSSRRVGPGLLRPYPRGADHLTSDHRVGAAPHVGDGTGVPCRLPASRARAGARRHAHDLVATDDRRGGRDPGGDGCVGAPGRTSAHAGPEMFWSSEARSTDASRRPSVAFGS